MADITDYLTRGRDELETRAADKYAAPVESLRGIGWVLIDIAKSLRVLSGRQPESGHTPVDSKQVQPPSAGLTDKIMPARVAAVRDFCNETISHDDLPHGLTNRAWACRTVLNILDGNIDEQLNP